MVLFSRGHISYQRCQKHRRAYLSGTVPADIDIHGCKAFREPCENPIKPGGPVAVFFRDSKIISLPEYGARPYILLCAGDGELVVCPAHVLIISSSGHYIRVEAATASKATGSRLVFLFSIFLFPFPFAGESGSPGSTYPPLGEVSGTTTGNFSIQSSIHQPRFFFEKG